MIVTHPRLAARLALAVPVLGVTSIILCIWWYTAVEGLLLGVMSGSLGAGSAVAFGLATAGMVLTLWSFLVTALTHPGRAPAFFMDLHPTDVERVDDDLPPEARGNGTRPTLLRVLRRRPPLIGSDGTAHCRMCKEPKPVRAHHDSVSGQCILRMDHFCPWTGNTIGLCNYKPFFQFVTYAMLTCALLTLANPSGVLGGLLKSDSSTGNPGPVRQTFGRLLASVLALSFALTLAFFVAMHSVIISRNQTTLEAGLDERSFNLGSLLANWKAVFGENKWAWFLPIPATDALVASRMGTFYRRTVTSVNRSGETAVWQARQREWQRSKQQSWLARLIPGLGSERPTDWLFWWPAESHLGAGGAGAAQAVRATTQLARPSAGAAPDLRATLATGDGVFGAQEAAALAPAPQPGSTITLGGAEPSHAPSPVEPRAARPMRPAAGDRKPLKGALVVPGRNRGGPPKTVRISL
ncbi:hypothetical protein FNF27_04903 [Cafeteria roenbergensis]|uniref:Palmitoyltransferase n=1 Tax=Cafeteria roenbergensis TaxID=33653 RepID=A0A5A8EA51_CAFRO|nr:hypothetical protein FNF29_06405 [Cafeteria roenbergensis]KAA0173567.1 hypothetical protein FNF27_04903 [Cafeteria roenbergensis]|eukprot:KAA0148932.1 hypothetical protein FNF29_06405 [Cafeteria roenbergensis]